MVHWEAGTADTGRQVEQKQKPHTSNVFWNFSMRWATIGVTWEQQDGPNTAAPVHSHPELAYQPPYAALPTFSAASAPATVRACARA